VLICPLNEGNTELNKLKNFDFLAFDVKNEGYWVLVYPPVLLSLYFEKGKSIFRFWVAVIIRLVTSKRRSLFLGMFILVSL